MTSYYLHDLQAILEEKTFRKEKIPLSAFETYQSAAYQSYVFQKLNISICVQIELISIHSTDVPESVSFDDVKKLWKVFE